MSLFAKPSFPLLVPEPGLSFLDRMKLYRMLEEGRWAAFVGGWRRSSGA